MCFHERHHELDMIERPIDFGERCSGIIRKPNCWRPLCHELQLERSPFLGYQIVRHESLLLLRRFVMVKARSLAPRGTRTRLGRTPQPTKSRPSHEASAPTV